MNANIKKYVKERDEMLLKCDVNELRKFINTHKELYRPDVLTSMNASSDEVLTITLHKMIVNVTTLPRKLREKSAWWLVLHGFDLHIN